jgi:hypothetical protein
MNSAKVGAIELIIGVTLPFAQQSQLPVSPVGDRRGTGTCDPRQDEI